MTVSDIRFAILAMFPLAGGLGACMQDPAQDASQDLAVAEAPAAVAAHAKHGRAGRLIVTYTGDVLPADLVGTYDEAFDCTRDEGGAFFGNVDSSHCFRKSDGSAWRVWNTGCGWEVGFVGPFPDGLPFPPMWQRFARTYSGLCAEIPASQLDIRALTTSTFFDSFGVMISGLTSSYLAPHGHRPDHAGM